MVNTKSLLILWVSICFLMLQSCNKDEMINNVAPTRSLKKSEPVIFSVSDQGVTSRGEDVKQTVLGDKRENPYTVEVMTRAWKNVYNETIDKVETTDLYVKFEPRSLEDIELLYDTDEFFYDFPLEYEVIEMGDYYQEIKEGKYPTLYAVVKPDFGFPGVRYDVLAELHIADYDTYLTQEAFAITGNDYVGNPKDGRGHSSNRTVCDEDDAGWPECQCDMFLNGDPELYQECIDDVTAPPPPPPPPFVNDCGCEVYSNQRKPGGCVKVEDTELSTPWNYETYEPVRRVKVIVKNGWFTEDETWTDDNGCWKINKEFKGKMWMWVKFKNDRCMIRGTAANWQAAWEWVVPVKDYVGVIWGPNFNDIVVNYNMWTSQGSNGHRYWGAATTNNALHEFYDYAAADGLALPPSDLEILIARNQTIGYAIMVQDELSATVGAFVGAATFFTGPYAGLIALISWGATKAVLADICVGTNHQNSDRLKVTAYHEFAHASHYAEVGSQFWLFLVEAEALAGGHGNANSWNAPLIALCESWAEHIGLMYAHNTYGFDESWPFYNTHLELLEERRNEDPNHVPIGYYYDMIDDINTMEIACDDPFGFTSCGAINDQVSGFTNAQMFTILSSGVTSVNTFTNILVQTFLGQTTNTQQNVNDLLSSY